MSRRAVTMITEVSGQKEDSIKWLARWLVCRIASEKAPGDIVEVKREEAVSA